jgi:RIO kinase 1
MASILGPVEHGQFDDAPEQHQLENMVNRGAGAYIDTHEFDEDEDEEDGDSDYYEIDDTYEEDRVEDEDWEVAERGIFNLLYADGTNFHS